MNGWPARSRLPANHESARCARRKPSPPRDTESEVAKHPDHRTVLRRGVCMQYLTADRHLDVMIARIRLHQRDPHEAADLVDVSVGRNPHTKERLLAQLACDGPCSEDDERERARESAHGVIPHRTYHNVGRTRVRPSSATWNSVLSASSSALRSRTSAKRHRAPVGKRSAGNASATTFSVEEPRSRWAARYHWREGARPRRS